MDNKVYEFPICALFLVSIFIASLYYIGIFLLFNIDIALACSWLNFAFTLHIFAI